MLTLIFATATAAGFGRFKNAKPSVLQVEPNQSLSFDPAHHEARVNLEPCKTKRTLYIPDGLLMGDSDNSLHKHMVVFFPKSNRISAEKP